ncbi:hypothetical protein Tco_0695190 [Tanacetum coccineum]
MPHLNQKDYQRTKAYLPRIHRSKAMDEEVRESYRRLERRLFHKGRFNPLDISRNPIKEKGKRVASPLASSSFIFTRLNEMKPPSFLEFNE